MKTFTVHIYREMRLVYEGIDADSHEVAAAIARDKLTSDADEIDDCDGETFAALVDVQGDEEYEQSRIIDFQDERLRKAVPALLAALQRAEFLMRRVSDGDHRALENLRSAADQARDAIARADTKLNDETEDDHVTPDAA
jgi:hypothetical protein